VIEDAVRDLLADRAEHAPVRVDGQTMLERVRRRRRARGRGVLAAAAAAGAVGVLIAADAALGPRDAFERTGAVGTPSATRSMTQGPAPATRTVTWGSIRFEVPSDWTVNDTHEVFPHPSTPLTWGPFFGTLRTGPMCWSHADGSGGCARSHGMLDRRPTEGLVAWLDAGLTMKTTVGSDIGDTGDPGPAAGGVCPPGGTTFHAFRPLRDAEGTYRVVVDGCAYGPRTKEYLAKLTEVANSVRF
jgi:hypothetical protein